MILVLNCLLFLPFFGYSIDWGAWVGGLGVRGWGMGVRGWVGGGVKCEWNWDVVVNLA